jgi:hypothetical protein
MQRCRECGREGPLEKVIDIIDDNEFGICPACMEEMCR